MSRPNCNLVFDVIDEFRMILSMATFANFYNCCKCSRQIPERILQLLVTFVICGRVFHVLSPSQKIFHVCPCLVHTLDVAYMMVTLKPSVGSKRKQPAAVALVSLK